MDSSRNVDWDRAADYYDAFVRTDLDIPFFLRRARAVGGPVLELMCGTGRITLPLAEAGLDVTGLDSSAGLLRRLRAKAAARGLTVQVVEADARDFELGSEFRLVLVGFHAIAEVLGRGERRRVLECARAHLAVEGRFVLTLHNPPVRAAAVHGDWRVSTCVLESGARLEVSSRWELESGGTRVTGVQRYRELDVSGGPTRDVWLPITFDLVSPTEIDELAAAVGLEREALYGDYDESPFEPERSPYAVFVMRRR